ncbi:MAG: phosphate acyltransferase PlsX [Chitinophagaceae bacterium]
MRIGIDMMGGDFAPIEALAGIQEYLVDNPPAHLVLIGQEDKIRPLLPSIPASQAFSFVPAEQVINMQDHPARALKEKPQSSISIGFGLLATGNIDAFISAGNTGAMLVGALHTLKPVTGLLRPTISTLIPKENGSTGLLLDVGLNTDCKPEHLNQFALMGSTYAQTILGIPAPRVALMNIGEEEGKGNLLTQAAYALLKANEGIQFVGNIEGRDLFGDKADVMVCDGFTGNVVLKLAESLFPLTRNKGIDHPYFDRFNFENYGGTPVLGISKPVVIGHGISKSRSFKNMLLLAQKMLEKDVLHQMGIQFSA